MSRRAWLTPDTPTTGDTRCRRITVPDDLMFIGAVTGALLPLTQSENWEKFGSMEPSEAADIMSEAFEGFVASDCEGVECPPPTINGVRIIRISPTTGKFEELAEDGETWQDPTDEFAVPNIAPRAEETEEDRKCAAATNAAYVMRQLYNESLALWEDAIAPLAAFEAFGEIAGELANAALTALLGAYAPFVGTVWGVWYATMEILTTDVWTDSFDNALSCLLLENATETDGAITFDYGGVTTGIFGAGIINRYDILLLGQVSYLLGIIGADGLNLSGETTAVSGDCGHCGDWCHTVDFTQSTGGFFPANVGWNSGNGTWSSAGWTAGLVNVTGSEWSRCMAIHFNTLETFTLTGFEVTFDRTNGVYNSTVACQILRVDGVPVLSANSPQSSGSDQTISWTGSEECSVDLQIFLRASYRTIGVPSPQGSVVLTSATFTGTGFNPFGTSDCA